MTNSNLPLIDALYSDDERAHIDSEVVFEDGRKGTISADLKIESVSTYSGSSAN